MYGLYLGLYVSIGSEFMIDKSIIEIVELVDGIYDATQSGYELLLNGIKYHTRFGIRGINFPVKVMVKNGVGVVL